MMLNATRPVAAQMHGLRRCSRASLSTRPLAPSPRHQQRRNINTSSSPVVVAVSTAPQHTTSQDPTPANTPAEKQNAQSYINSFAAPVAKSRLAVYAAPEEVFCKLLLTPELDAKLKQQPGDSSSNIDNDTQELQHAAHIVEAAVAEAIRIAYGNNANSSASHAAASTTTTSSNAPSSASPQQQQHQQDDDQGGGGSEFGCVALGSDDQCVVDWDSESLWDNAAATGSGTFGDSYDGAEATDADASSSTSAAANAPADGGGAAGGDGAAAASHVAVSASVDGLAHAAVALEGATGESFEVASAHTFLQRLLYRINRLNHFWYDDLSNYVNERSAWVAHIRDTIEAPWQEWEMAQLLASPDVANGDTGGSVEGYRGLSVEAMKEGLKARYAADVDPPLSPAQQYVSNSMDVLGYCHLLAVGSVDGLVEASRQSRVCAGAANPVSCAIFRVLMEEYGTGRYSRKHSTFYKTMMEELGLNTKEEHYLDLLPWQWLAAANHNFLLTERRRHYLRYAGALTFFEINGPSVYKTYLAAGRRNGLSDAASGYWELHIKEDERHGRQMLEEVALPLVDMYPRDSWEMLLGYDQDRFMGARAGAALVKHIQVAAALSKEKEGQALE